MKPRRLLAVASFPFFLGAYVLRPSMPPPDPSMPNRMHYYYIETASGLRPFEPSRIPPTAWIPTATLTALGVVALAVSLLRR